MTNAPNLTALLVDDRPENLTVLVEVLTRAGFKVLVAEDGEAALETAARVKPDVIFLDVGLPGIDGYETCRRLKAGDAKDVPVLFVTAREETADRLRGFAAGGIDFVTKPFRPDELLPRARAYAEVSALRRTVARAKSLLEKGDVEGAKAALS